MKKNFILTFIAACIPGCGQMYYGFMKRGVSLLAIASATFFIAGVTNVELFIIPLPIVWFYSFFDTYSIRNSSPEKLANTKDDFIFADYGFSMHKLTINGNKWIGVGLVVLGLFIFYNTTLSRLVYSLVKQFDLLWVRGIFNAIPSIFVAIVLVILGLNLIKGGIPKKEEIIEFKGDISVQNNDVEGV